MKTKSEKKTTGLLPCKAVMRIKRNIIEVAMKKFYDTIDRNVNWDYLFTVQHGNIYQTLKSTYLKPTCSISDAIIYKPI